MEWWMIAIVAGVVLIVGLIAYFVGFGEGYHNGRADDWDERKALYALERQEGER